MKIVALTIGGTLTPGDELLLHITSPAGGRTTAGATVAQDTAVITANGAERVSETMESVITGLQWSIDKNFLADAFKSSIKGNVIRIECADSVSNINFLPEVKGAGTETMSIAEF